MSERQYDARANSYGCWLGWVKHKRQKHLKKRRTNKMSEIEFHPLASMFPLIDGREFAEGWAVWGNEIDHGELVARTAA